MFFLFSLPFFIARGQETPDHYLMIAAENNAGLRARFNDYLAALEKAPQVGSLPDPQLMFGYFISPVETRVGPQQARISLSQRFPWFGTLRAARDASGWQAEAALKAFEASRSELFFEVRSLYYELYFIEKTRQITAENLEILRSFRNLVLSRIEAGDASSVDEIRLAIEIAEMENQLLLLSDRYGAREEVFLNKLNHDEPVRIVIPDSLAAAELMMPRESLLDSIRQHNPSLQRLDHQATAFAEQEKLAGRKGLPDIFVGADYIFVGESETSLPEGFSSGKDAVIFPQVGISVPLYRSKYRAMADEASYRKESSILRKEDKMNDLESMLEEALKDHRDATRRLALYGKNTELATSALNIMETDYVSGRGDFEEILRMERKLLIYRIELERARADQHSTVAFINYLTGE